MLKKMMLFTVFLLVLGGLFATVASAAVNSQGNLVRSSGFLEKLLGTDSKVLEVLKAVFVDFKDLKGADSEIVLKSLFGLLLFTILFGVSQIAPGISIFPNNIRLGVTIVLSLISIVFIPTQVLVGIATTYGVIFFSLLVGVPVLGGAYLIFTTFSEPTRINYISKFIIAGVLWYVMGTISSFVKVVKVPSVTLPGVTLPGVTLPGVTLPGFTATVPVSGLDIIGSAALFVSFVTGVLALYYGFKSVFPGASEPEEITPEARRAMRSALRWWSTRKVGSLLNSAPGVMAELTTAIGGSDKPDTIDKLRKMETILKNVGEAIGRTQSALEGNIPTLMGGAPPLLNVLQEMVAAEATLTTQLGVIRGAVAPVTPNWATASTALGACTAPLALLRSRAASISAL